MRNYTVRDIAEIGIFTGIAIVLNLPVFKIKITPDAGSISFAMIPLFILAIRHSWWKTLIASSLVFGLIACLIGGHGLITYPLDYCLAYSGIVIISLFRKKILSPGFPSYLFLTLAVILATTIRFFSSVLSSMLIYEYSFVASLIYNAPYIFITGAIGLLAGLLLLKPLKIVNEKYPNTNEG